jgi:hypothetical protein
VLRAKVFNINHSTIDEDFETNPDAINSKNGLHSVAILFQSFGHTAAEDLLAAEKRSNHSTKVIVSAATATTDPRDVSKINETNEFSEISDVNEINNITKKERTRASSEALQASSSSLPKRKNRASNTPYGVLSPTTRPPPSLPTLGGPTIEPSASESGTPSAHITPSNHNEPAVSSGCSPLAPNGVLAGCSPLAPNGVLSPLPPVRKAAGQPPNFLGVQPSSRDCFSTSGYSSHPFTRTHWPLPATQVSTTDKKDLTKLPNTKNKKIQYNIEKIAKESRRLLTIFESQSSWSPKYSQQGQLL